MRSYFALRRTTGHPPRSGFVQLMRLHYPLLPVALLRYPLATCADVGKLHGELLLLHGDQDGVIPLEQSERIRAAAPQARLVRVAGAAHADIHRFAAYQRELLRALQALP